LLAATKGDGPATTASAIEVLDGRLSQSLPAWRAGNVLVALPELSAIAVVDPKAASVAWLHRGIRALRSQPMVLASGKLLLFDSPQPDAMSRVVELDPVTEELGWTYQGKADAPLASYRIGSCQRLPNGNTLIVESEAGRAFEVTSGGELVWEYFNPHLTPEGDFIAGLCEVERIDTSYVADAFPAVAAALDDAGKVIDTGAVESLLNHK